MNNTEKNQRDIIYLLFTLVVLAIGGFIGSAMTEYTMHRAAIANRAAHWEAVGDQAEFAWGDWPDNH